MRPCCLFRTFMITWLNMSPSLRRKNYAFEFVESINAVVQIELMNNIHNASFHTLIVDENTDITIKSIGSRMCLHCSVYRGCYNRVLHRTQSGSAEDGGLTSDGVSVMLGKHNGVATILKRKYPI